MVKRYVPRILLVDSEPNWSQEMEAALEEHGRYEVERVADMDTAFDFSYGDGFDLILINAALAFGDSVSKFEKLVHQYSDRVLVISDVRSITTAIKVFKMGADYADKPFEPRRVVELVTSRLQPEHGT